MTLLLTLAWSTGVASLHADILRLVRDIATTSILQDIQQWAACVADTSANHSFGVPEKDDVRILDASAQSGDKKVLEALYHDSDDLSNGGVGGIVETRNTVTSLNSHDNRQGCNIQVGRPLHLAKVSCAHGMLGIVSRNVETVVKLGESIQ